ncbi:hypothetical protein C4D60_Mb05t18310 [Musa balbisiana]|uniref:Cytochrome P450 n=1 Tax=Musa balbisiana TaxID=52838 RepID=A0A4S8JX15_MUSBA|nr:hypothetical protein C4D60_Mb05t18310 [Musa balbisiana]
MTKNHVAFLFFSFAVGFVLFSMLLLFLRKRRCCSCDVCKAYVSSSWAAEFDNLCDWYAHLLRESPTGTIHIHVLGNTVTANPANVEYMLRTRFDNFPKGKPFSALLGDLLGQGIFNVDGDAWRFQRKMASLALGSVAVRSYAFGIVAGEIGRGLLPLLSSIADRGDGAVVDLQDVFRRFAFDTICKISFGLDRGYLELPMPMSEFAAAFDTASRLSARRGTATAPLIWKLKRLLNIGSERELKRTIRMINVLAEEVIRQRRKLGFASSHDLLSRFMGSVVDDDDKYIRDIVISFLLAGRDAVASGLSSFFLLLSRHQNVAKAMREEIAGVTKANGADVVSYEQLKEMHYVHAAIYESMRLFPPVQFDSKFCLEDDVLPDGTFVSRNTRVTYHPYAMGRMDSIWGPDCDEFRPGRWLRGGVFTPESLFKYPVFQAGQRVCLGKELALMEMKTVIVSVVSKFDVEVLPGGRPLKFVPGLTATINGGLPARVCRPKI